VGGKIVEGDYGSGRWNKIMEQKIEKTTAK
jgi:hypothetical protein